MHRRVTPNGFRIYARRLLGAGGARARLYHTDGRRRGSNTFHGTLTGPTARHYEQEEKKYRTTETFSSPQTWPRGGGHF